MKIKILQVNHKRQLKQFIRFPHTLYKGDPFYIPALNFSEQIFLSHKNPFFQHSEAAFFLAINNDQIVGRIAAIHNRNHLRHYSDQTGFFGFFDTINDQEVANTLFQSTTQWLKQKGLHRIIGPTNFTTNDSVGLLTQGFDQAPVVQMPYNKPYYESLCLKAGFSQAMELYAYRFDAVELHSTFLAKAEMIEKRLAKNGIQIRPIQFRHFQQEMEQMREVYNLANQEHWGFVPLTREEFLFLAKDLRQIVKKENVLFAEKDGQIIGYFVTVPDVNQIFAKIPKGQLLPFGWTKLVWPPPVNGARMLILGVLPAYRHLGIDWSFFARTSTFFSKSGITWTEAGYVMQHNQMMNRIIQKLNGKPQKVYRLYQKDIYSPPR